MEETLRHWRESPASRFSPSKYLPALETTEGPDGEIHIASHNTPATLDDSAALERLESIVSIVALSGREMGRDNTQRIVYIRAMGQRFAAVDSLHRSAEISGLIAESNKAGIDLDDQSPEVKQALIQDIQDINKLQERANGTVDPDRLRSMIARVRRKALATITQDDVPQFKQEAATRLLEHLPDIDDAWAKQHTYELSADLVQTYGPRVRKKYADFLALIPEDQQVFNRQKLRDILDRAKDIMADTWQLERAREWHVAFKQKGSNVNVNMEDMTVWIPENYGDISREKLEQLLVHEMGGHLLRNLLGEQTGDIFYATSLPGRSSEEEALLTLLESTLGSQPKYYDIGIAGYLGVGLGLDKLDTGHKFTPHELQRVMVDLALMNPYNTEQSGQKIGLSNTSRLVRGMPSVKIDGKLYQAIQHEDIKYARGQSHALAWLQANIHNPGALDFVMSGKFAYSDKVQAAYGRQLYDAKIKGKFAVPSAA